MVHNKVSHEVISCIFLSLSNFFAYNGQRKGAFIPVLNHDGFPHAPHLYQDDIRHLAARNTFSPGIYIHHPMAIVLAIVFT